MTDNLTPEQLRSAELNELRQSIAEHESLLERLRTVPTEGMPAEEAADHAFEVYKMEHEVDDLKAELEDVQASPLPRTTRSLGGAPANGLAVVIGHSIQGKDSGALGSGFPQSVTGDMRKEVYWNTDLANMIAADARARGIPCQLFERKRSGSSGRTAAYNEVKAWGPKATVELHFNSYNTTACGTETLYGPDGCRDWAAAVHKKFLDVLKPAAEAKGVSRSRGAWPDRKLKQRNSGRGSHSFGARRR